VAQVPTGPTRDWARSRRAIGVSRPLAQPAKRSQLCADATVIRVRASRRRVQRRAAVRRAAVRGARRHRHRRVSLPAHRLHDRAHRRPTRTRRGNSADPVARASWGGTCRWATHTRPARASATISPTATSRRAAALSASRTTASTTRTRRSSTAAIARARRTTRPCQAHTTSRAGSRPGRAAARPATTSTTRTTRHAAATGTPPGKYGEGCQVARVDGKTSLVTLSIGGNDAGFADDPKTCYTNRARLHWSHPCSDAAPGINGKIDAVGPKLEAALQEIRRRAPHARIVIVTYPRNREACQARQLDLRCDRGRGGRRRARQRRRRVRRMRDRPARLLPAGAQHSHQRQHRDRGRSRRLPSHEPRPADPRATDQPRDRPPAAAVTAA
jgi:GDSL-like Lipase/Acylhydrolase family